MKREFSAGGVIFKKDLAGYKFLLINNAALKDPSKSYWGFPKGHLDPGETSKDAALREVKEEVGIEAEILEKIGDSKYVFPWQGEKIFKIVTMFLMEAKTFEIKVQQEELLGADWFDFEPALKKISFSNDKQHLKKAKEILDGK